MDRTLTRDRAIHHPPRKKAVARPAAPTPAAKSAPPAAPAATPVVQSALPEHLTRQLLSRSRQFESDARTLNHDLAREALALLGTLDGVTRESFALAAPPVPAAAFIPAQGPKEAAFTPPLAPVPHAASQLTPASAKYGSHREEYRPALKDRSIVDALLDFHRQNRLTDHEATSPVSESGNGFKHLDPPAIDTRPKERLPFSSRAGASSPVLRPSTGTKRS